MSKNSPDNILSYLKSTARNKIVLFRDDIPGVEPFDIGIAIAEKIVNLLDDRKLSFKAKNEIDKLFSSILINHETFGKLMAISNIGILFEPDLKIDILSLFERFSCDNALFIKWDGEIETGNLYFLSKYNGIKINLKNISHIII